MKPLNPEQSAAIDAMITFLDGPEESFFLLKGSAGTGKTYCIQELINRIRGRLVFTAPTNKATKVLRATLTSDAYKPDCRTIYSLLGLRLEANGEVKELASPEDPIDLTQFRAVIVDEASMVNDILTTFIKQTAETFGVKFIFLGDPAQLPPVGEQRSNVWRIKNTAILTKVERHDNQILELATRLRGVVDHPAPSIKLTSNNADGEGVWQCGREEFFQRILSAADVGDFTLPTTAKVIAWRNVTVDAYNKAVRAQLFDNAAEVKWLPEDRVILMAPAKNLEGDTVGRTDDEGRITHVVEEFHPLYPEFKVWRLSATTDDNNVITLRALHDDYLLAHNRRAEELALAAKTNRRLWGKFWEFKEAFHQVRHSYAITAHRAQGSTYDRVYVDWRDILLNHNRGEAFRCLYVACTRPRKELYLG